MDNRGQLPLFPDMGGTTGGEREATSDIVVAVVRDPRRWGPIQEPEIFWSYWLHEEVVADALAEVTEKARHYAEESVD